MPVNLARIERLEKELEEARRELLREDGERYRILMREITDADRERILGSLTDKRERVLFGLEAPEEPQKRGAAMRPGGAGGDLTCPVCGKSGLTKRGLGLIWCACIKRKKRGKSKRRHKRALRVSSLRVVRAAPGLVCPALGGGPLRIAIRSAMGIAMVVSPRYVLCYILFGRLWVLIREHAGA